MHDDLKPNPDEGDAQEQDAKPQEPEDREAKAKEDYENGLIHFGKIDIDSGVLS